jgi:hypothetical protein
VNETSEREVLKLYCLERALVALLIAAHEVGVDKLVEVVSLPSFLFLQALALQYYVRNRNVSLSGLVGYQLKLPVDFFFESIQDDFDIHDYVLFAASRDCPLSLRLGIPVEMRKSSRTALRSPMSRFL